MKSRRSRLRLGIDLIETKKAKNFYAAHKGRLQDFFGGNEILFMKKSRRPHEKLAMLLAAKEAVFKSLELPWLGPSGFKDIRLSFGASGAASFRLDGYFQKKRRQAKGKISFIQQKGYVVALCRSRS